MLGAAFKLFITCGYLQLILIVLIAESSNITSDSDNRANYTFTTCGSRDREGPTYMECIEHYCNSGSPVCGHLLNEGTRGSQIFVVPRSGNYTVTIAGASGGHGVCSNYSGLGVIVRETVQFRRGEILRILVGQRGASACDGHQDIDICQISNDTKCANLWNTTYRNMTFGQFYLYDGGGGGGGASLLEDYYDFFPIVIAPGGGGAGAIYNTTFLSTSNITCYDSKDLKALYRNYTYGHAFETTSKESNGTIGNKIYVNGAGSGAGYYEVYAPISSDPDGLRRYGFGGLDCDVNVRTFEPLPFPDTHGGFGGGGGGCDGGGGGGGYTGGSIIANEATIPGEGGYSWPDPPWPLIGYNDGDGYVELFLESCGCTYNCTVHNQSSFECSCPSDTLLALNGFDCYTEENYYVESKQTQVFTDSTYGEISTDIFYLTNTIFAYSIAVTFNNDSVSNDCAVLLINDMGELLATTKFINRSSDIQYLELFLATTMFDQNGNISTISLSMNSELMLEEPLYVASVITFGIESDCILEELMVNASIDEIIIYEPDPDQVLDLSDKRILNIYLNSFNSLPITGKRSSLSTGVIAGIIIAGTILVVSILLVVGIYFYHHHHKKSNYSSLNDNYTLYNEKTENDLQESHKKINISNDYSQVDDNAPHEYEKLVHGYENVQSTMELEETGITTKQQRSSTLKYGVQSPLQDYYHFNCSRQNSDWSCDRAQLIYMREISEGQFGKVLLMTAKNICGMQGSVLVAVKTLTSRDPKDIQRFSEEMDLMKKFIHPNIVSLLGHCEATSDGAPMMILELMQYGDLKWFLQSNRPNEMENTVITERVALNIVTDIASALQYLSANHYVHRDVAARNCLIGEGFKAKLSDFGLARGVHEKDYYIVTGQTLLPVRWMAPESLLYGKFTSTSDVWSYGVLVWEVVTYAETPHDDLQSNDIIEMAGNGTLKLGSPRGCPKILAMLISQCTRIKSKDRPTFDKILEFCNN